MIKDRLLTGPVFACAEIGPEMVEALRKAAGHKMAIRGEGRSTFPSR